MDVPGTEEDRCIVEAGDEAANSAKDSAGRYHAGDDLLEAGQDEGLADLDSAAVPEKLVIAVDAKPVEVLDTDGGDATGPALGGRGAQVSRLFCIRRIKPVLDMLDSSGQLINGVREHSQGLLHPLDLLDGHEDLARRRTLHRLRKTAQQAIHLFAQGIAVDFNFTQQLRGLSRGRV